MWLGQLPGYWLWILRDAEKFQLQAEGPNASWDMARLELGEDGEQRGSTWGSGEVPANGGGFKHQ